MSLNVVTICRNNYAELLATANSVAGQTMRTSINWVVVDGASTEPLTKSLLRELELRADTVISRPDNGPYEAMNNGLEAASDGHVIFMNSGDVFYDNTSVASFLKSKPKAENIYFGDAFSLDGKIKKYRDQLWKGNICCHQSAFVPAQFLKSNPFNLAYQLMSDYGSFCEAMSSGVEFKKLNARICKVDETGISSDFFHRLSERYFIAKKYCPDQVGLEEFYENESRTRLRKL